MGEQGKKYRPGLNYIEQINWFWRVNIEYDFTGNESKLYFYLLHISNSLGWKNPFRQSFRQIQLGSGISKNSIKSSLKRLIESDLISVVNGKNGNPRNHENKTIYKLLRESNFDHQVNPQVCTQSESQSGTITKGKDKDKPKLLSEVDKTTLVSPLIDYFEIAFSFWEMFKENLVELKISTAEIDKAKFDTWVNPIQLLIESDKKTVDEIREVYTFIKEDDFWGENIRSTTKLRKRNRDKEKYFDKLLYQSRNGKARKSNNARSKKGAETAKTVESILTRIEQTQS